MIFWKIDLLANKLLNSELTEKDKIKYYIALMYLQILSVAIPGYLWGSKIDVKGILTYGISAAIASVMITSIYYINAKIDGKNVIERLVIMGLPAFIKSTVIYWSLYIAFSVLYWVTKSMNLFNIFSYLGTVFYYWIGFELIRRSLKKKITQPTTTGDV